MENKLDKYFKDNLHNRKFEMNEEYWLSAEKLLNAQDKRRKRRVIFWWFSGGLGALLLVGFGFWVLGKNGGEKPVQTSAQIATQSVQTEVSNTQNMEEKQGAESGQKSELEATENQLPQTEKASIIQEGSSTIKKQLAENQPIANKKTRSLSSKAGTSINKSGIANESQITGKKSESGFNINGNITAKTGLEKPANQFSETSNSKSNESEEPALERTTSPDFLALLPCFVTGDFNEKYLATTVEKIDVANPRRLRFGLLASQMLLPNAGKGEKTFIGQRAGLVLRYDFRNKLYLSSGVQYLHRTGSFDASKSASQRNYRFGLELDSLELRPTSLHYLSLPVLLGFQENRHQMEAGLLIDFLTGVRGETGSYKKQGEPPVKVFKTEKSGWVTSDGYRRIAPTLQLNYRYNLVGRWSLGLSANYMIGGILDKNYDAPVGSFLLKETEKFQLGAQVVYLFN